MVPAIFHGHEVSVADVHKKVHWMRLADEHFHLVVNLLAVVEEICPLFGVERDERTRIASRMYAHQTSSDGERPILAENEQRIPVFIHWLIHRIQLLIWCHR